MVIHQEISNCLPHSTVTKIYFWDALTYILKHYTFKNSETIRKDYITRSIIIMIYKYGSNVGYSIIKKRNWRYNSLNDW